MSDVAIKVEGLGKKYLLRHQFGGRSRYVALRDVLTEKAIAPFRKLGSGFKPRASGGRPQASREEFWALKDVSFEIKQGEAVGIIGRNGAGKSTLLKLLSRITPPTRGRIELDGRLASLLEVGTGFHPELTGRENIFLNGAILGMARAEIKKKFDEIVAFADVEKFLDTPVKHFSSGMYMRLAFAVAAHLEQEILIVDEVLAVGDAAFQKKCLGKMKDVSQSGRTVLFVSHNMEAITRLCVRCLYLVQGELKMQGETRQVIKAYSEHSKQATREIDLTLLPRRFEATGGAQLLRLRGPQNETTAAWCYGYGTPLEFSVEFSVSSPLDEPEIGYAIFSITGMELLGSTTYQECPLDRLLPGRYVMRIAIPDLCLNPGTYVLALGIAAHGRSADHILEAAQIEIIPSKQSIEKGLHKIWAPFTPRTIFELNRI
jgi:lipopolysaccharide transport system ATP-binding protein